MKNSVKEKSGSRYPDSKDASESYLLTVKLDVSHPLNIVGKANGKIKERKPASDKLSRVDSMMSWRLSYLTDLSAAIFLGVWKQIPIKRSPLLDRPLRL